MRNLQTKELKRLFLKFFLLVEIFIFGYAYIFGTHGLQSTMKLKNENSLLSKEMNNLKQEIKDIEDEIEKFNTDDFYKEKIARENLQMAHKNDKIYYY